MAEVVVTYALAPAQYCTFEAPARIVSQLHAITWAADPVKVWNCAQTFEGNFPRTNGNKAKIERSMILEHRVNSLA